ncbi:MAG: hypothetical protein LQ342_006222 [Letrouitia transgressa]|nr:MAG: hypothetical protein LQ342_006222 [Letrouitia transgressa]
MATRAPSSLCLQLNALNTVLEAFRQALISTPADCTSIPATSTNVLSLLHDSASLLKAQTTKLSLLLLNQPFSPSAIAPILSSITADCLPALLSCLQLCLPDIYTSILHKEIRTRLNQVIQEFQILVRLIPADEQGVEEFKRKRQEILSTTGVVWEVCDRLATTAQKGLVGLVVERADAWLGLVKDAIEELEEWDPGDEEDDFGSDDSRCGSEKKRHLNGIRREVDEAQVAELKKLKEESLKVVRLIRLLFPAVRKRRLLAFPPIERTSTIETLPKKEQVAALDQLIERLHGFSEEIDEVAGALYATSKEQVEKRLRDLRHMAEECIDATKINWNGEEDEFTVWSCKWMERLAEMSGAS